MCLLLAQEAPTRTSTGRAVPLGFAPTGVVRGTLYAERQGAQIAYWDESTFPSPLLQDYAVLTKEPQRGALIVIQAGICDGDHLGTRSDSR